MGTETIFIFGFPLPGTVSGTGWASRKCHCAGFSFILAPQNHPLAPPYHRPTQIPLSGLQLLNESKAKQVSGVRQLPAAAPPRALTQKCYYQEVTGFYILTPHLGRKKHEASFLKDG